MKILKVKTVEQVPPQFTGVVEYYHGNTLEEIEWIKYGFLHRDDGPAKFCAIGKTNENHRWYNNGMLHKQDGPAIYWIDGTKQWWLNGNCVYANNFTYEYPAINVWKNKIHLHDKGFQYVLLEDDIVAPEIENGKFGNIQVTFKKVLTEHGISYIPNLPGL